MLRVGRDGQPSYVDEIRVESTAMVVPSNTILEDYQRITTRITGNNLEDNYHKIIPRDNYQLEGCMETWVTAPGNSRNVAGCCALPLDGTLDSDPGKSLGPLCSG